MSSSPRPDSARVRRKSKTKEQDGYAPTNNNTHKANGTHQTYKQSQQQNSQQQQQNGYNNKYSPNQERQRTHPPSERQKYIPVDQRTKRQPQHQQQSQQQSQPPPPQQQQQQQQQHPQQEQQQQEHEEQQQATEPTEFNPSEVEQHLQQVWNTVFDQARDTKTTENERPIVYQDSSRAWGTDTKISFLSNFNFSTELKKAYIARYGAFPRFVPKHEPISDDIGKSGTNNTTNTNTNSINNSTTPNGNIHSSNILQNNIQSVNNGIHSTGDSVNSNEKTDRTKDNINSTTPNGKHNDNTKASEITSSDEISADSDDVALENGNAEEAPTENGVAEEAAGDDVAEEGQSHYNHDEYEEISDPTDDKAAGNPGDVIIDINDTGDDDVITTTSPTKAEGKKPKKKPKKNKSKQKNVNSAPNQGEQTTTTTTNNHVTAENNNNNTNATNTITISNHNNGNIILPSNNKEWEFLGTILPRPKSEFKTTGTGTLQVDNSGNFQFSQETLQTTNPDVTFAPQMLTGIPREAARVFADRFGKPNQANNSSYTTAVPVKWSSGESLAALRKFPMEVPLFLKDMLSVKTTSKSSCSNLKCQNTTSEDKPFKTCAKCNVAAYCSRECQKEDWVKRHKMNCKPNATASEEQRKTYATQKLWTTSSIRQMIFLHWHARYGKGVVVMMCRDFLASHLDEDPNGRELYIFYMPMADLLSEDCPLPALKKCQAEFTKSFVSHDSESQSIASAAMDSSGFILPHVDEVKTLQLKLYKRSCAREHDLSRVDAISVDPQNHATLYTFH